MIHVAQAVLSVDLLIDRSLQALVIVEASQ
jgi:hypothetical protein